MTDAAFPSAHSDVSLLPLTDAAVSPVHRPLARQTVLLTNAYESSAAVPPAHSETYEPSSNAAASVQEPSTDGGLPPLDRRSKELSTYAADFSAYLAVQEP